MPRPSITWLTTDTHFFHDMLVEEGYRPDNHNTLILKNLRQYVAEQDVLIHLGDVIFYQYQKLKGMLDSIPGKKILVMGNHDHKSKGWYMRSGFVFATDMLVIGDVLLSHRPQPDLPSWIRLNVHGHLHNFSHRDDEAHIANDNRHKLLAIETNGYMPVKLQEFAK